MALGSPPTTPARTERAGEGTAAAAPEPPTAGPEAPTEPRVPNRDRLSPSGARTATVPAAATPPAAVPYEPTLGDSPPPAPISVEEGAEEVASGPVMALDVDHGPGDLGVPVRSDTTELRVDRLGRDSVSGTGGVAASPGRRIGRGVRFRRRPGPQETAAAAGTGTAPASEDAVLRTYRPTSVSAPGTRPEEETPAPSPDASAVVPAPATAPRRNRNCNRNRNWNRNQDRNRHRSPNPRQRASASPSASPSRCANPSP